MKKADRVSLKIDSADEKVWRRINRPHGLLSLSEIREGAIESARSFKGTLVTETMLVTGINDGTESLAATVGFFSELKPWRSSWRNQIQTGALSTA